MTGFRMTHGKHSGELISRVPVGYLRWMVQNNHSQAAKAEEELARRGLGVTAADVDVSSHAIDRASLRLLSHWAELSTYNEGLHSWLMRMAEEALDATGRAPGGPVPPRVEYKGMCLTFAEGMACPVVATCWRLDDPPDGGD